MTTMSACTWPIDRSCLPEAETPEERVKQRLAEDLAVSVLWALSGRQFGQCPVIARPCPCPQACSTSSGDGFLDRYSGTKLVHPGVLRILSVLLPEEFPFHRNWLMTQSHVAFWELFPTIDHRVPVAHGGEDTESNWVSTSMLRNSVKAHWGS